MKLERALLLTVVAVFAISIASAQPIGALMSLVSAERRFAKRSVDTNIRDSFLAFFADDGIMFNPGPVNAKQILSKRPAPPNPPPVTLFWEPIVAEVSGAGDLGYTTGPYTLTDNLKKARAAQGFFFSIWKRQPDGQWKVVLDAGTQTPPLPDHSEPVLLEKMPSKQFAKQKLSSSELEVQRKVLIDLEGQFSRISELTDSSEAYARYLDPLARMDRDEAFPFVGKKAILAQLAEKKMQIKWEPLKADVSASGDLGYAYGNYESTVGTEASSRKKGYYARVWKRDGKGNWKIVMDTAAPAPREKKDK